MIPEDIFRPFLKILFQKQITCGIPREIPQYASGDFVMKKI